MPELPSPIRLLVVDDHEVVRRGLIAFLDRRGQFEVVAEAGTCAEAVSQARRFVPDLVLMDVSLPDASGIEACRLVHDEEPDGAGELRHRGASMRAISRIRNIAPLRNARARR